MATDFSKDELRRQLQATQRDHDEAMPAFAAALDEAFDPDAGTAEADRARLLGLPGRRGFLKVGGMSVALATLAAACVQQEKEVVQLPQTGTLPATTTTAKPAFAGSSELDVTLVLTALSLEELAIDTYQAVLDGNLLQLPLLVDVAKYFQGQHKDHAGLLTSVAGSLGQAAAASKVTANAYLQKNVVDPGMTTVKSAGNKDEAQTAALKLAVSLEDAAAQTYSSAAGLLTTTALRQGIMSIGPIEAKHVTVLNSVLEQPLVPFPFEHTTKAAPPDSLVTLDSLSASAGTSTTTAAP